MTARRTSTEEAERKLRQWSAGVDALEKRVRAEGADKHAEFEKHMAELEAKKRDLEAKIEALRRTGGSAGENILREFERAMDEAKNALTSGSNRVSP